MFITPLFGGCKYTNKILIINNIAVFQHFNLLITFTTAPSATILHIRRKTPSWIRATKPMTYP